MNYTYLASQYFNPDINASDIFSDLSDGQLHYICYHVTTNGKYPFVQIMLDNNLLKNEFDLPFITINEDFTNINIATMILRKIKADLKRLKYNTDSITTSEYKGIFIPSLRKRGSNEKNICALIDVSSIDISCLNLSKSVTTWFALPTEIININSVCNISVSSNVLNLFQNILPELGVLFNNRTPYLLPDVVYTFSDNLKEAEFRVLFGPSKIGNYFYFCTSFSQLTKDSKTNSINRYALFIANPIQKTETETEGETEDQNDLCILDNHMVLVTEYESFTPLSYHKIS